MNFGPAGGTLIVDLELGTPQKNGQVLSFEMRLPKTKKKNT